MTNRKNAKRTLVFSALAILLCAAMLLGVTFAWFTDTASNSVNKIQAGKLDVELYYKDTNGQWKTLPEDQTLGWKQATDADGNTTIVATDGLPLWEPGCTFTLPELKIVNEGNLALKYKIEITGIKGDAKLNEAIDWTMQLDNVDETLGTEHKLAARSESESANNNEDIFTISGTMKTTAGNEYQGLSIDGISITVVATQDTVEYDSSNNTYDANALYPEVAYTEVSSPAELANAITNATDANGNPTNEVVVELTTAGTYTLPDLNGKDVTIVGTKDTVIDMKGQSKQASSAEFEGVTVELDNSEYVGIQHTEKVVYKDCTIKGKLFLYADNVEFVNCEIVQETADTYSIWTYGAKNVTFTGCNFTSTDCSKAVLCYTDGLNGETLTRTFKDCTFTATGTAEKSAIMINPTAGDMVNTYIININNCTATGYGENNIDGHTIVGVKETVKDNITVTINGATAYTHTNN